MTLQAPLPPGPPGGAAKLERIAPLEPASAAQG